MPELPDLHVYANNLRKMILNKKIISAEAFKPPRISPSARALCDKLTGASICDITREGKELFFALDNHSKFGVHLMLSGRFCVCGADDLAGIGAKILAVIFEDGQAFAVTDVQGLCKITLNPRIRPAPDAMSEKFTAEYLLGMTKRFSWENIKALLLNQEIIRGIGNAYADEILWGAGISPVSIAGRIPEEYVRKLHAAVGYVLNDAISSIERISPDITGGEERSFLKVHNPQRETAPDGEKIIKKTVAQKTTYYTAGQKLF